MMTQRRSEAMKPSCWLRFGAMTILLTTIMTVQVTSADDDFCQRPVNMEICWFNNVKKRFLRFGRGDPFLRFGKRSDAENLEDEFLRFGRSLARPSLLDLLASEGVSSRKRRDVSAVQNEAPELKRATRDVKDGGFLRFGRGGISAIDGAGGSILEGPAFKRADVPNGDREYLRFGRGQFPRWGKRYLRFGRGTSEGFLRFGKRSS